MLGPHALPASSGRCYDDIDASFNVLLAEVCINVVPLFLFFQIYMYVKGFSSIYKLAM